jgi:thioredoxin-like negative regulator of GroEL
MLERLALAFVLIGLGVLAYRLLLSTQHRRAATASGREDATGRPALLVFTSPTCAPCKLQQMPIVDRLMSDWGDRLDLRVIDVTERPDTASRFGVWSLPTTIVLDADGRVTAINQGVASEHKLAAQFERVTANSPANQLSDQRLIV